MFLLKDLNRNKMARYDVVIVGAGLFGSLSAYKYKSLGRKVLVIDKRSHVGGRLAEYKYYDMNQIVEKVVIV